MRSTLLNRCALLTGLLAAAFLTACDKNTYKPPQRVFQFYQVRATPQDVLTNLQLAYSLRDSVEYKALYDSSYAGTSTHDTDPPGTLPLQFTFADEAAHIATLARTNTISRVNLSLGSPSTWNRLPSDDVTHPEWAVIQIPGGSFSVEIMDAYNTYTASGQQEFNQFTFQPTTPDTTSPTDTTWQIIRWTEARTF